jgi:hypothetical protein
MVDLLEGHRLLELAVLLLSLREPPILLTLFAHFDTGLEVSTFTLIVAVGLVELAPLG